MALESCDDWIIYAFGLSFLLNVLHTICFCRTACSRRKALAEPKYQQETCLLEQKVQINTAETETQTVAAYAAEITAGRPLPLDLVVLIDASFSISTFVRQSCALLTKEIVRLLTHATDGSAVYVSRFGSTRDFLGSTADVNDLYGRIDRLLYDNGRDLGETWLAESLEWAHTTLLDSKDNRQKAIVLMTDGVVLDKKRSSRELEQLSKAGVKLLFVLEPTNNVQRAMEESIHFRKFVHSHEDILEGLLMDDCLLAPQEVYHSASLVLERVLRSNFYFSAVKCSLPLGDPHTYVEVSNIEMSPGLSLKGPFGAVPGKPSAPVAHMNKEASLSPALPAMPALPSPAQPTVAASPVVVHVETTKGRSLPLDIVFCLDSSYSVGNDVFGNACQLFRSLLDYMDWPESRCGVIRFASCTTVLREMSCEAGDVESALRNAEYKPGETNFLPMLQTAHGFLKACSDRRPKARRMILVASDDYPNDDRTSLDKAIEVLSIDQVELIMLRMFSEPEMIGRRMNCCAVGEPSRDPVHSNARLSAKPWCVGRRNFTIIEVPASRLRDSEGRRAILEEQIVPHVVRYHRWVTRAKAKFDEQLEFVETGSILPLGPSEFELKLNGKQPMSSDPSTSAEPASAAKISSLGWCATPVRKHRFHEQSYIRNVYSEEAGYSLQAETDTRSVVLDVDARVALPVEEASFSIPIASPSAHEGLSRIRSSPVY